MRRSVEIGTAIVAVAALALVLYNATLVDRRPPSVVQIALSAASTGDAHVGQTLTAIDVQFSEPVRPSTVEPRFRIEPRVAGTFSWDGESQLIFTPSDRLPPDSPFVVSLEPGFEDLAGNVAPTAGADPFAFRTVGPPSIVSSDPADGATGIAVDSAIRLVFDRLMDTEAVQSAVSLEPARALRPSWSGPELTLTPEAPLDFGSTYTLTIGSEAADTDGSAVAAPVVIRFTTVSAGLEVVTVVPEASVSGVDVRSPIALVFDGAIDPASISGALTVVPPVGGDLRVAGVPDDAPATGSGSSASTAAAGRTLLFTPSAPLAAHTTYTIELRPVVRRLGSEAEVAPDRTWSFTTGQPTPSVQNQIAFLSARAGVLNVWAMNPDGSNARQLTSELAPVTAFDVSADGESLLYGVAGQVVLQRADGSDRRVLTAPDRREYAPVLAPDGRSYLVARREAGGIDSGYWIVPMPGIADLAERQVLESGAPGAGSVRLTGDGLEAGPGTSGWGRRAAFSLDGKLALVVSSIGESWLVDLGAPLAVATKLPIAADGAPSWSESGGWFLLVGREVLGGSALFRVRTGGVVDRLWDAVGPAAAATNGGVTATVADPAGGAGVVRVAYASSSSAPPFALTTAGDLVDRSPSFSPDGGEIVFTRARRDAPTRSAGIWIVGLDGRELRQLSVDGASARWLP